MTDKDDTVPVESERGKVLRRSITGALPSPDKWDAEMQAANAWTDPELPLLDRVDERRKQLLQEREKARDEYRMMQARMIELKVSIDQITGAIHVLDELVDVVMGNGIPPDITNE